MKALLILLVTTGLSNASPMNWVPRTTNIGAKVCDGYDTTYGRHIFRIVERVDGPSPSPVALYKDAYTDPLAFFLTIAGAEKYAEECVSGQ